MSRAWSVTRVVLSIDGPERETTWLRNGIANDETVMWVRKQVEGKADASANTNANGTGYIYTDTSPLRMRTKSRTERYAEKYKDGGLSTQPNSPFPHKRPNE